jgi:hypothetical protein
MCVFSIYRRGEGQLTVIEQQYFEIRSRNINKLRETHDPVFIPPLFHVLPDRKQLTNS